MIYLFSIVEIRKYFKERQMFLIFFLREAYISVPVLKLAHEINLIVWEEGGS
jgi:hypothetical protein